jgi:two-component system cell cycle sensor histidine kinase/response regulator CckA
MTTPAAGPVGGSETILVVEDEDAVRHILIRVLQQNGYRVLEAPTPSSACDLFDVHRDRIDILVTDVMMPKMNGPALAQRFVELRPDLAVLFVSGYADVRVPLRSDNPKMRFLMKPFQSSALAAAVRDLLDSRGRRLDCAEAEGIALKSTHPGHASPRTPRLSE